MRIGAVALLVLLVAGCGGGNKKTASTQRSCPVMGKDVTFPVLVEGKAYTATVQTSLGTFAFSLDVKDSPCTTSSFAHLARGGFFDGLTFHRTEPPGTSGSQFFVVTGADAGLQPDYALLGKVTTGLDVVERIGRAPTNPQTEQPLRRIVIRRITVSP